MTQSWVSTCALSLRGCRGAGAGKGSLVPQSCKRTSAIQAQKQGPVGSRVQQGSCSLCTSLFTASEQGNPLLLPTVLPIPVPLGALGWQGDRGEMCTSAERADGGEDEPDNYCLESLTRIPSKIMAQILRKGAL